MPRKKRGSKTATTSSTQNVGQTHNGVAKTDEAANQPKLIPIDKPGDPKLVGASGHPGDELVSQKSLGNGASKSTTQLKDGSRRAVDSAGAALKPCQGGSGAGRSAGEFPHQGPPEGGSLTNAVQKLQKGSNSKINDLETDAKVSLSFGKGDHDSAKADKIIPEEPNPQQCPDQEELDNSIDLESCHEQGAGDCEAEPAAEAETGKKRRRKRKKNRRKKAKEAADEEAQCDESVEHKADSELEEEAPKVSTSSGRPQSYGYDRQFDYLRMDLNNVRADRCQMLRESIIAQYHAALVTGYNRDRHFINSETAKLLPEKIAKMTGRDRSRLYDDFLRRRVQLIHPALCDSIMAAILSRSDSEIVAMIYDDELLRGFGTQVIIDLEKVGYNLPPKNRGTNKGRRK